MVRLTPDARFQLILAHDRGDSFAKIARSFKCNVKTVSKWVRRWASDKTLQSKKPRGPDEKMSTAARKRAVQLLISREEGGLRYVAQQLLAEGLTTEKLSCSTVSRGARAQAKADGDPLMCLRGRPKQAITARTKAKRLAFARANRERDWSRVLITDRSRFYFQFPGQRVASVRWVQRSKRHSAGAFRPNHPSCVNVYGGVSRHGVTKLVKVTGTTNFKPGYFNQKGAASRNITKSEYTDVSKKLVEDADAIFGGVHITKWVFQQDNDPTHAAAKAVIRAHNMSSRNQVELLPNWPPHSPDLSVIENVWATVDREVAKKGCATFEEFEQAVMDSFNNLKKDYLANLFDSIPGRLQMVEQSGGEKTKY